MIQKTLNLYEYFSVMRPEGAVGDLVCQALEPMPVVTPNRKRPAVLILPGGGYHFTSEREAETIALPFIMRGYAAFTLYYSVAPLTFPTALRETAMAMRYIRENAEAFCVDAGMVAAIGFSAGGHLCGTLGTMYDIPELADIAAGDVVRPNALGLCYPVLVEWGATHQGSFENLSGGDRQLRQKLSVEKHVRPDMPPVFLWHTRNDELVPCRNSIIMAQALEEAGVDFALHLYRQGRHGLSNANDQVYATYNTPAISRDVPQWLDTMMDFFAEVGFHITDTPANP